MIQKYYYLNKNDFIKFVQIALCVCMWGVYEEKFRKYNFRFMRLITIILLKIYGLQQEQEQQHNKLKVFPFRMHSSTQRFHAQQIELLKCFWRREGISHGDKKYGIKF